MLTSVLWKVQWPCSIYAWICAYVCVSDLPCSKMESCYLHLPMFWSNFILRGCVCVCVLFRCVSACVCVFCDGILALLSTVEVRKCCSVCPSVPPHIHTHTRTHSLCTCGQLTVNHSLPQGIYFCFFFLIFLIMTVIIQLIFIQQMSRFCLRSLWCLLAQNIDSVFVRLMKAFRILLQHLWSDSLYILVSNKGNHLLV